MNFYMPYMQPRMGRDAAGSQHSSKSKYVPDAFPQLHSGKSSAGVYPPYIINPMMDSQAVLSADVRLFDDRSCAGRTPHVTQETEKIVHYAPATMPVCGVDKSDDPVMYFIRHLGNSATRRFAPAPPPPVWRGKNAERETNLAQDACAVWTRLRRWFVNMQYDGPQHHPTKYAAPPSWFVERAPFSAAETAEMVLWAEDCNAKWDAAHKQKSENHNNNNNNNAVMLTVDAEKKPRSSRFSYNPYDDRTGIKIETDHRFSPVVAAGVVQIPSEVKSRITELSVRPRGRYLPPPPQPHNAVPRHIWAARFDLWYYSTAVLARTAMLGPEHHAELLASLGLWQVLSVYERTFLERLADNRTAPMPLRAENLESLAQRCYVWWGNAGFQRTRDYKHNFPSRPRGWLQTA